ncbi:PepSY domain-containing protein [Lactobacillus helveticus]|uniref:PepSY domain-containing protein n=1 Tax=Lactobacillus helveticus TaxID=1587 RepID=UPI001F41B485|nr:PepSY domain-containing protein [Lactobacillus helveticus]
MVGYVYEVEGFTSTHEYNVEINAKTGKIIDHESNRLDHDDKKHAIKLTGIISHGKARLPTKRLTARAQNGH